MASALWYGQGNKRYFGGDRWVEYMAAVDPELLEKLVCPVSHAPLIQVGAWLYSTDRETRRRYPIRDGIPIMLIDEAEEVTLDEFLRITAGAGDGSS
ncbi:MAG: Trm112 family protein [Phycisphaerae bacterium]